MKGVEECIDLFYFVEDRTVHGKLNEGTCCITRYSTSFFSKGNGSSVMSLNLSDVLCNKVCGGYLFLTLARGCVPILISQSAQDYMIRVFCDAFCISETESRDKFDMNLLETVFSLSSASCALFGGSSCISCAD